eukprot:7608196-Pyramimonas_sp.AAC.1
MACRGETRKNQHQRTKTEQQDQREIEYQGLKEQKPRSYGTKTEDTRNRSQHTKKPKIQYQRFIGPKTKEPSSRNRDQGSRQGHHITNADAEGPRSQQPRHQRTETEEPERGNDEPRPTVTKAEKKQDERKPGKADRRRPNSRRLSKPRRGMRHYTREQPQ